ncbi:hypothetical protein [Legionella fairfieldensis]|uniref:hypothetical protein n=1 Tax=Legionella fairfieldensis TaxID=45064 RepID=UPI001041B7DC|nr:hypothetical protein [Legionella fairfieldensis]
MTIYNYNASEVIDWALTVNQNKLYSFFHKLKDEDFKLILDHIKTIESDHPNYSQLLFIEGMIYLLQEQRAKGIGTLEEAASLGNWNAMKALIKIYIYGKRKDYPKAVTLLDQFIVLNPRHSRALYERGRLYESGFGCPVDLRTAAKYYWRAYTYKKAGKLDGIVDNLKRMAQADSDDAVASLFLIYWHDNKIHQLSELCTQYFAQLDLLQYLFYKVLIQRLDKSPEDPTNEKLINLFIEHAETDSEKVHHLQFRVLLINDEGQEARAYYKHHLQNSTLLGPQDYYLLGTSLLKNIDGLKKRDKIDRLEQCCFFYYKAYQSDKSFLNVLIKLLKDKEALEQDGPQPDAYQEINEDDVTAILNRFVHTLENKTAEKNRLLHLHVLQTFKRVTQHYNDKKYNDKKSYFGLFTPEEPKEKTFNTLKILNIIIDKLQEGISLPDILSLPSILRQIKKNSPLYNELSICLADEANNPLLRLLDKQDCEKILKQPDSVKLIFNILKSDKLISQAGLQLLAQRKKDLLAFIQELPANEQLEIADLALDDATLMGQFIRVQQQQGLLKSLLDHDDEDDAIKQMEAIVNKLSIGGAFQDGTKFAL